MSKAHITPHENGDPSLPKKRKLLLAPGFANRVRDAVKPSLNAPKTRFFIPKAPRSFAHGTRYVQDETTAEQMLDFTRQRSLSHIGIGSEFKYDRAGVMIDMSHTAYDPRSVHPLLLSLVLVEQGNGGTLYRFVVDLRCSEVLPALGRLLRLPCVFVGHCLHAQLYTLWKLGLPEPDALWDTCVCEKAVHLGLFHEKYNERSQLQEANEAQARAESEEDEEFRLSLPATCRRHGVDYPFAGDQERLQRSFLDHPDGDPFSEEQIQYSSADAEAAAKLYLPQVLEAAQAGLIQHSVNIEMPWIITSARMGWCGVRIDQEKCRAIDAAGKLHLSVLKPQLETMGISNPKSFNQLEDFFAGEGLLEEFRRGGKISFDKDQLENFEQCHPTIPLIRAARRILDFENDRILTGELVGADGRVHADYRQLGTATGRQSCRWPNVMGLGRIFRPLVIPEPGRGIGEVDWCQIEVGIAAAVYGDEKLVELFNSDDVYSAMAKHFYRNELCANDLNLPGSSFKVTHGAMRARMKICTLGIIYGFTPHGLSLLLQTSVTEATSLQQRFMAMFPVLSSALKETWNYGGLCGHVCTVSGLRRHRARQGNPTNWEKNWMTNHPVQGSAAVVFKAAGNRLDKLYFKYDAWLIIPMHDAFVFEAPLEALREVAALTERVMIETVEEFFPTLRPKVEVNIGQPQCWNKDGHADSLERWIGDPTYSFN